MNPSSTPVRLASPATRTRTAARHAIQCLLFAASLVSTAAFGADVTSESRPVGAFRTVRLVGSADLVLTQADTPSLTVEGTKDALPYLKADLHGDELTLSYEPKGGGSWWNSDKKGPRFLLSAKTLDRISTAGSGDVQSDSFTVPGDFEIVISGSSDIKFTGFAARKLLVRISGAGDVTLAGGVLEQNVPHRRLRRLSGRRAAERQRDDLDRWVG